MRPDSLMIGSFKWTISFDDAELQRMDDDVEQARFGVCLPRQFRIVVGSSNRPESAIQETLVHEILHAIYSVGGHGVHADEAMEGREELTILALSPWLFGIIQDNPDLMRYLQSKEG